VVDMFCISHLLGLVFNGVFLSLSICFFFFSSRRRHTRLVSDWSSDVCSSDLNLEAIHNFRKAGILYGPSKAANAGGVAVSGLEMTQNSMRLKWSREETDQKLQEIMKDVHAQCAQYGKSANGAIDYVKGANIAGFIKVADAMLAYGVM